MVLSAIFFVSTAISRGWIGPTAQLVLATAVSLAFVAQSFRFDDSKAVWRPTFAAGGAAGFFVSGVVGHLGLDLLPTGAAAAWLSVAIGGFLLLSRLHDSEVVAALAAPAMVAGVALLAAAGIDGPLVLLASGAAWALALAVTTRDQAWPWARMLGGIVAASILSLGAALAADDGLAAAAVPFTLVGIGAVVALVWQQGRSFALDADKTGAALLEMRVAAAVIPWTASVAATLIPGDATAAGIDLSGVAVVAIGLASGAAVSSLRARFSEIVVTLHQLASLTTVGVGAAMVFDGPTLLVSLLGTALAAALLADRHPVPEAVIGAVAAGSIVVGWTVVLILHALDGAGLTGAEMAATGAVVATVLAGVWRSRDGAEVVPVAALAWLGLLGWLLAAWRNVPQEQMWVSISWAAAAVALILSRPIWFGPANPLGYPQILSAALATLGLTGAKLVFVDFVAVDVLWRAGLFLVIGATFLRLAFVLPELHQPADDDVR